MPNYKNRFFLLIRNHKLFFPLVIAVFLFMLSFQALPQPQASKETTPEKPKPLKLFIQSQPFTPLTITETSVDSTDPITPSIKVTLLNTSNLPIRAYTIKCETHFGKSNLSSYSLNNISFLEKVFRPQQARTLIFNDAAYSQPAQFAVLSVDFVEYLDSTRWGEDTYKSGERLDGWRTGAHTEAESILSQIRTNGLDIVLNHIQSKNSEVEFPSNVSPEYLEGFRLGIDAVRARILHTESKNKPDNIVNELQRPIDLSDYGFVDSTRFR